MKSWQAIEKFLEDYEDEFPELQRFVLTASEWSALEIIREILMVGCLTRSSDHTHANTIYTVVPRRLSAATLT